MDILSFDSPRMTLIGQILADFFDFTRVYLFDARYQRRTMPAMRKLKLCFGGGCNCLFFQ